MEKIVYEIWLQLCLRAGNEHIHRILEVYPDAEQVFLAGEQDLRISGVFTAGELNRVLQKELKGAEEAYRTCVSRGYRMMSLHDPDYPSVLRLIKAPPLVLYIKGSLPALPPLAVAVVGTRSATRIGCQLAFELSYYLTRNGALIVSGGAEGIDTHAHRGALQAGGQTVCVLGCGLDYPYLKVNASLREEISRHGALITEYVPDAPSTTYSFASRNRIIAALTDCTVVAEAGKGSGALITAADAAEQGKTVFAVPSGVDNPSADGSNRLLKLGVTAVTNYRDVLVWDQNREAFRKRHPFPPTAQEIKAARFETERPVKAEFVPVMAREPDDSLLTGPSANRKAVKKSAASSRRTNPSSVQTGTSSFRTRRSPAQPNRPTATKLNEKPDEKQEKLDHTDNISTELLTANAKSVYDTISETPMNAEAIAGQLGLPIRTVLSSLTELELLGLAKSRGFGEFSRK